MGHRKVVINSLEQIMPGVDLIAGVAQMGGGQLSLVLSTPDLIASCERKKRSPAEHVC